MSQMHIFVSYAHEDDAFARRLVSDLQQAGAEVWYDVTSIDHGDFMGRIDDALRQCEWLVLVLTPAATASQYVRMEVNAALHRVQQGLMRAVIPVLAAPCPPNSIPALWDVLQRYDGTRDYGAALAGVLRAVGLTPSAPPSPPLAAAPGRPAVPAIPPDRFPPRLAQLGFVWRVINGVEVIIPPVCDVPGGEFLMGSDPRHDVEAESDEKKQHRVTLPAYQIGRFPVTVAEYACYLMYSGQHEPGIWRAQLHYLDRPVVYVTWHHAVEYAAWLTLLTGDLWCLPSEAEWEKAARWDPATRHARIYPWGDGFDQRRCNTGGSHWGATTPVGAYPAGASPCGAHDLAGNVWEWTSSVFRPYPYRIDDGRERTDLADSRVLRGGSWSFPRRPRAAGRYHRRPGSSGDIIGFRLARVLPGS